MSKMFDLGAVSAYALDKEAGYTGTYEEWQLWTSPHVKGGYWWVRDTNTGVPVTGGSSSSESVDLGLVVEDGKLCVVYEED